MNTHMEGQTKVKTIAGLGASVCDQAQLSMCKSTEHSSCTNNNKTKQQSAAGKLLFSERPDSHSAEQSAVSYNSKHTWYCRGTAAALPLHIYSTELHVCSRPPKSCTLVSRGFTQLYKGDPMHTSSMQQDASCT